MLFLKGRCMFHGSLIRGESGVKLLLGLLYRGCCYVGTLRLLFFKVMGMVHDRWIIVKECLTMLLYIVRYYLHSTPNTN